MCFVNESAHTSALRLLTKHMPPDTASFSKLDLTYIYWIEQNNAATLDICLLYVDKTLISATRTEMSSTEQPCQYSACACSALRPLTKHMPPDTASCSKLDLTYIYWIVQNSAATLDI